MLSRLRMPLRGFSEILAIPFVKLRIHPNVVSLIGAAFLVPYVWFALQLNFPLALLFAVLASGMDMVDGSVARLSGKKSNFGNYFETMIDKVVDFVLIGTWALLYPLAGILALCGSFMSSYAKPRAALVIITDNRDWPGIGEHSDKLALLLLGILASIFVPTFRGMAFMEAVLYLIAAVSFVGAVQRISYARHLIREAEAKGTVLPYLKK